MRVRVLINLTYLLELHILVPVTDTALAVVARRALQLLLRVVLHIFIKYRGGNGRAQGRAI